jgi:hypothetical protein
VAWDRALFERAVDWGDWELIGPFLARGADLQGTDIAQRARAGEFDHEVTDAARRGDLGDLERLIALGASPDGGRIPALSVAASEAVEAALIAAGADPSRARPRPEPRERPTELHRAVQDDQTAQARLLLEAGARPAPGEPDLVGLAMAHDNDELVQMLLEAGYPYTEGAALFDIHTCRTDRLAAQPWPDLDRQTWRAALQRSACAPALRAARKQAHRRDP